MKDVIIITPGGLPVPSVKGGAVQNLIEHIIKQNQIKNKIHLSIICPYDVDAVSKANLEYKNNDFIWIKIPKIISLIDNMIYNIIKRLFKETKAISFRNNMKILYYAFQTGKHIKNKKYDCVVVENNVRLFWGIKLFGNKKRYDGRVFFHLHNIPRTAGGCKAEIQSCKRILCVSEFVKNNICSVDSKIGKYRHKDTKVLYNCIDINKFNPYSKKLQLRRQLGFNENDIVVIFSGRLSYEKGVLEVIKAVSEIRNEKVKLLIVGADFYGMKTHSPYEDKLCKESKRMGKRIVFTGYIDYDNMPDIYRSADIAVLPSMWEEPAGLTIIEAMACGLPVITTYSGGIPEYVKNGAILIHKDEHVVRSIRLNLEKLIENHSLRDEYALRASERAAFFSSTMYYDSFISLIENE